MSYFPITISIRDARANADAKILDGTGDRLWGNGKIYLITKPEALPVMVSFHVINTDQPIPDVIPLT